MMLKNRCITATTINSFIWIWLLLFCVCIVLANSDNLVSQHATACSSRPLSFSSTELTQKNETTNILKTKTMTEEQAEAMINLLVEISTKLTDISNQISGEYEVSTISEKLDDVVSNLINIDSNTAS